MTAMENEAFRELFGKMAAGIVLAKAAILYLEMKHGTTSWSREQMLEAISEVRNISSPLVDKAVTEVQSAIIQGMRSAFKNSQEQETGTSISTNPESEDSHVKAVSAYAIAEGVQQSGVHAQLENGLAGLNTMRGGASGFKGFVFEEMHAARESLKGTTTEVISDNGIADFKMLHSDGTHSFGQAKVGYHSRNVDWSAYQEQEIVIDKGNTTLIEKAKNAGMNVVESEVSSPDANRLAKTMQFESRITGKSHAPITSKVFPVINQGSTLQRRELHSVQVSALARILLKWCQGIRMLEKLQLTL